MKTIELKWIEDDNHVVAEDAFNGLRELIETGVFKNIEVKCENDTLFITGEQEVLDKVVMKIQKDYAKYGQIMIKEAKNGGSNELRIESFDENVQDIFNHILKEYNDFKADTIGNNKPTNYITKLGDFQMKFKKFKEVAKNKDKKYIEGFLKEIETMGESTITNKIKPIKTKLDEKKPIIMDMIDSVDDVVRELVELGYNKWQAEKLTKAKYKYINDMLYSRKSAKDVAEIIDNEYMSESSDNELMKHLGNPKNWGIIDEAMSRKQYNSKYDKVALAYAKETGMDLDDAYDELMDIDELVDYIEGPYDVDEIIHKLLYESTSMNESFDWNTVVEPLELAKTIKEINSRMNLSNIIDITSNHNSIFVNTDPFTYTIHLNKKYLWIEKSDVNVYKQKLDNGKVTKSDLVDVLSFINTDVRDMKRNFEESTMNESFLSPAELKKKLQRVAARWASIKGVKFEEAYNELRKKKSVKDMLDFYSVDEIIDDLSKNKKEVDDVLDEEI